MIYFSIHDGMLKIRLVFYYYAVQNAYRIHSSCIIERLDYLSNTVLFPPCCWPFYILLPLVGLFKYATSYCISPFNSISLICLYSLDITDFQVYPCYCYYTAGFSSFLVMNNILIFLLSLSPDRHCSYFIFIY